MALTEASRSKKVKRSSNKKDDQKNKNDYQTRIFLDRPLLLLSWPCGLRVLWSSGPLVRWSTGPLVPWSLGPFVLWFLFLWSTGPLAPWSFGPGPVPWSPG